MSAAVISEQFREQEAGESAIAHQYALESCIGNTPLIRLRRVVGDIAAGVEVFVKAEHINPGGSVKDRAALRIIEEAERSGELTKGKTLLDATSGNTGIAYAMICAARGYKVALCVPRNASDARKNMLRIYGAEIIETDPVNGTDAAQIVAKEIYAREPHKYFYADQYNNPANWRAHYDTTAPEIWRQTEGRITHFVAGLGTTGTFIGTSRRLKELSRTIRCVSMQPDSPLHGLEGMKHLETAIVPGIYDATVADEQIEVSTDDAQTMTVRLAREEGLFVGTSAGANVFAAVQLAQTLPKNSLVVTVLCDGGAKYLAEGYWK